MSHCTLVDHSELFYYFLYLPVGRVFSQKSLALYFDITTILAEVSQSGCLTAWEVPGHKAI